MANFTCDTIDSAQGSTFHTAVLAIPDDLEEWSTFLADPKRMVIMFSRTFRMLALPRLTGACKQMPEGMESYLRSFSRGDVLLRWWHMRNTLGHKACGWESWDAWLQTASGILTTRREGEGQIQSFSTTTQPADPCQDELTLRGCSLTFLRCLKRLLPDIRETSKYIRDSPNVPGISERMARFPFRC